MAKKINFKNVAKEEMANVVLAALEAAGLEFSDGAEEYGFKGGSIVVHGLTEKGHDVRIDFTTPKAGEDTYQYAKDKLEAELAEKRAKAEAAAEKAKVEKED